MSVPSATRRLMSELNSLLDKEVVIKLKDGSQIRGKLYGFDVNTFNILLKNASDSVTTYPTMLIYHDSIISLSAIEAPLFDPEEFARIVSSKLSIRESDIKVLPEAGVVVILNSIRVSEKGVEGSGPLAHKVYGLFTEYIESKKKEGVQG
uniref:Sm domain-containing protein n=1 Tax=Fervidicoccus fontis TaxID=683846 RepID=A0A7J3ZL83_9CREN